jgi:hypothetical protein
VEKRLFSKNVHARLRGICMQLDAAILMFESMVLVYHFESQNVINRDNQRTPSFPTHRNFFTSEGDRFDDGCVAELVNVSSHPSKLTLSKCHISNVLITDEHNSDSSLFLISSHYFLFTSILYRTPKQI